MNLKISTSSNIFKKTRKNSIIIFYNIINNKKINLLKKFQIRLIKTPLHMDRNFDLKKILLRVKMLCYSRIFLESGIGLMTNFLHEDLINDLCIFISNKKLGRNGDNSIKNNIKVYLKNKKPFKEKVNLMGDKLFTYRLRNV